MKKIGAILGMLAIVVVLSSFALADSDKSTQQYCSKDTPPECLIWDTPEEPLTICIACRNGFSQSFTSADGQTHYNEKLLGVIEVYNSAGEFLARANVHYHLNYLFQEYTEVQTWIAKNLVSPSTSQLFEEFNCFAKYANGEQQFIKGIGCPLP